MITKNLSTLKIHKLTREQYERELNAGNIDANAIYLTPDEDSDLSHLATKAELLDYAKKTDLNNLETTSAAQAKLVEAKAYADGKAPMVHNHDSAYDVKGAANTALENAKAYVGEAIKNFITSSAVDSKISSHNVSASAHNDIRTLITTLTNRFNALANSDDETLDQLNEIVAYIKSNKSLIDSVTTNKVNVADIINNLSTNVSNRPLSAAQGAVLKGLIDALTQVVNGKADAQHTHNYLPLSGGSLTGTLTVPTIDVTGTSSSMASHYYHRLYGDNNVYVHYYNTTDTDFSKTTTATLRVSDATNKTYRALQFSGDGNFKWNNAQVLTELNYGSYIRTLPYLAATQAFSPAAGKDANLTTGTSRLYANALVISNPTTANDVGWIRVTGTGESDTVLEIATGDDGGGTTCESIVARQYNTSNGVARQAVLLASDGTSAFPVSVSAPAFLGNATSASHTPMIKSAYGAETQMTQTAGDANIRFYFNVSKGKEGQFATGNNANTLICINRHSGHYESQLAFSDNGELYYRSFSGVAPDTTTAWKTLLTSANYLSHDKFNSIGTENYIAFPGGGSFITNQGTQTGYMKITLPVSWTSTMIRFKVQIYNYSTDTSCEYVIAGYNYSNDSKWYHCSAYATGKFTSHSNLDVSFGHDGSKCAITIGSADTSWSYAQVRITDVLVGYSNYNFNTWKTGWNVGFTTTSVSPSATVKATHVAATAGNADYLDGYHGSTSAVKNTYVLRTNDNYIYTNYINSNTSNSENPSISQVIVTNGSDHFYRKASLSHLRSSLGLTYDIKEAYISSGFNTSFRTTLKGSSSNGTFLSVLRSNSTLNGYITAYASGFAWGKDDTQGFISVGYNDQTAYIGGGNADKLNWVKQISFTDHTHSYLPLSGGTMGANAAVKFSASAGTISVNDPMSITYGRIASYGTLCINGDTDGSTNESVIITAGRGHSSSASDGLSVGYSSLTWQGNSVVTVAGATMAGKITGSTTQGSWISCTRNGAFRLETAATGGSASSVLSMKTSSGAWSITNLTGSNSLFFCFGTDSNYSNGNNTTTNIEFSGGTIVASLSGNASTASKWQTARTLTLTGAVTGSASIDGSGNVSLATSVNHNHDGSYVNVTGDAMSGRLQLNTSVADHTDPTHQCLVINCGGVPSGTTLTDKNSPGIGFHIGNNSWASLILNGGNFKFVNSSFNGYVPVFCSEIIANTWRSQTYGGGWYMTDSTWIRS